MVGTFDYRAFRILIIPPCAADLNGDGQVDGADLAILLANWGTDNPLGDLNGSGEIDGADLTLLLANWG